MQPPDTFIGPANTLFGWGMSIVKKEFGFPIYAVEYSAGLSIVYVAGGGGPAKSGIRNSIVPGQSIPLTTCEV